MGTVNHVFMLGNGFDINLDLATSYEKFYNYYLNVNPSKNDSVSLLKKKIKSDLDNWSDLELNLGRFTELLTTQQSLDDVIEDVVVHLSMYLNEIESNIDYGTYRIDKFLNDLVHPERVLTERDQDSIREFKKPYNNNKVIQITILTFNYTKVIENLLDNNYENFVISDSEKRTIKLQGVEHIHGYVRNRLILGLNDIDQFSNKNLRKNIDAVELLVKPSHNDRLGHLRDKYSLEQIEKATMIYIFGSSIGETDKVWWQAVGRRLLESCRLVIYYYGEDDEGNLKVISKRKEREIIKKFLSLTDLNEEEKNKTKDKIYVSTTKNLFKLKEI